jgi:methionine-rich copper-binding protein CopC
MTRTTRFRTPPRLARAAVLAAAGALLVSPLVLAAPASAHDSIVGSVPADGATLTAAPTEVRITFEEPPTATGLGVAVLASGGASVVAGKPTIEGNVVVQALDPLTVGGAYAVSYRVVSADGHPVTGTLAFTVDLPTPSPSASSSAPAPTSASATSASSSATALASATDGSSSSTPVGAIIGGAVALALVVGAVVLVSRRRSA